MHMCIDEYVCVCMYVTQLSIIMTKFKTTQFLKTLVCAYSFVSSRTWSSNLITLNPWRGNILSIRNQRERGWVD